MSSNNRCFEMTEHELIIVCVHVGARTHDAEHIDGDVDGCYICSICRDIADEMGWDYVLPSLKTSCKGCLGI